MRVYRFAFWIAFCAFAVAFLLNFYYERNWAWTFAPVEIVLRFLKVRSGWILLLAVVVYFFVWYGISYGVLRMWITGSRRFKIVLAATAALGILTSWALHAFENRIDWTSRGLNPDLAGYQPQVVVMSGTFDYWINDQLINRVKQGSALFEIRMRGFDDYYCCKWHGRKWEVGSWFRIELALGEFSQTWGLSEFSYTTRGGGGSWLGPNDIILARRLWRGSVFTGVQEGHLSFESHSPEQKEVFGDLMKLGPYQIPRSIVLSEGNERREVYTIRKVEFSSIPSEAWFSHVKAKYFDHDPELRGVDLSEPGVRPSSQ